jgi:hypothetical protein
MALAILSPAWMVRGWSGHRNGAPTGTDCGGAPSSAPLRAVARTDTLSWTCDLCGDTIYGPALGAECNVLHGPARIR